jgi:hypothetical protein
MYTRGTYIPQPDVLRVHTRVQMYHFSCLHFSVNCIKYWVSLTYRQRVYANLTPFHFVFRLSLSVCGSVSESQTSVIRPSSRHNVFSCFGESLWNSRVDNAEGHRQTENGDAGNVTTRRRWRALEGRRSKSNRHISIHRPKKAYIFLFWDPRSVHFLTSIYVYIYRSTGGGRVAAAQFCKPTAPTPQTETIEIINFAKSLLFAEGLTTS